MGEGKEIMDTYKIGRYGNMVGQGPVSAEPMAEAP